VWLAVELSAAIMALCLVVSLLPAIECLLALPPDWSWKAAIAVTANGMVGSAYLGRIALEIPAELLKNPSPP
jgi:hypothetical protein